jgi:regulatory protein
MDKQLLNNMMAYCSRAERCVMDVKEKMAKVGASDADIQLVLEQLQVLDFINEERYAVAFVNDKFRFNKWGRVKIEYALRMKKIPSDTIAKALDGVDEEVYLQTLKKLLLAKQKTVKGTAAQQRAAVIRFGLSRGFEYACIERCL